MDPMNGITIKNSVFVLVIMLLGVINTSAQWVQVASPPSDFITDHTFGFAIDGKGYLVAGTDENGSVLNDMFQYDPSADEFTQLEDFPGGARGFAIGDTWNEKAYFGFGANDDFRYDDLWEFDPSTESWTELASCPCSPRIHPALIAHNDKVFVGLGGDSTGDLNDWWIYDMATDSWSEAARFPAGRRHHPYQFAIGEYVYVGFGHGGPNIYNTWYRYDIANDLWIQVASLPAEGRVAGQQFSWNGKGYILSGEGEDHLAMREGEFWSYDPLTDTWEQLPSHPSYSRWAPASFVIDTEIYIFNGVVYGFGPVASISEAYKYELSGVSSTETINAKTNFSIYPNPASDYLIIENINDLNSNDKFVVFDVLGNKVMDFTIGKEKKIDVSNLESGVYLLSTQGIPDFLQFVITR